MNERIYMSSPDVGPLEEAAVMRAMRSGWIAPLGPEVDAFEAEIAQRVGVSHAVALSSGTAALHLGLLALGVKPGDTVVTSTMTFAATTNAIIYTGAVPYFIDCLSDTGNMDPTLLEQALRKLAVKGIRPAAILPVDLLGKAVDYSSILAIANEYEVPVLADAAESLGATHKGKAAGSFGDASIFSFNGNKIMTTSGGGMLTTDDGELAQYVRYLATQAREPVAHYEHLEVGYNYRLSNLLAGLGRAQLSRLDSMISKRRELREQYKTFFAEIDGIEVFGAKDDEFDNVWLTSISIDSEITGWTPGELAAALASYNIECRPIWKPMHLQPVFLGNEAEINGTSEQIFRTHLTLPSGSALTLSEKQRIFARVSEFIKP